MHRFLFYGGAAGGGKSFFVRWWCAFYLIWLFLKGGISGASVGLFCEDYPSLLDRQISKIRYEFPRELGELREGTTRDFVLRDEYGGGRILLRNLDDPSKYLSAEFAGIGVDELTRNERSVFDFLRLRMRWPGVERPRFVGASNPGGKGHAWVKELWVDDPPTFPVELEPLRPEFVFIPAKAQDNPYLTGQYFQDLQTLPREMAKAYAEGSWDLFVGQYFTNFSKDKNTIRIESVPFQPWWSRWVSIDWGFKHTAAVYWHATQPAIDSPNGYQPERTITYRERVFNGTNEEQQVGPYELAKRIIDASPEFSGRDEFGVERRPTAICLSPDAWQKRTDEDTIAEQMGDVFKRAGWPRPAPADDDRIGGWMLMYQLLDSGEWVIGDNCTALIKCLPSLTRDEIKVEDIEKRDGDDPADAARYGLKSRVAPKRKPLEVRINERLSAMQAIRVQAGMSPQVDPTAVAMMSLKAQRDERKTDKPVRLITRGRWQRPRPSKPF